MTTLSISLGSSYVGYEAALQSLRTFVTNGFSLKSVEEWPATVCSPRPRTYIVQPNTTYEIFNERRRHFFEELVQKYGFNADKIFLKVRIKGLISEYIAGLVAFSPRNRETPYLVTDFLSHDASPAQYSQALLEVIHKAKLLHAEYAGLLSDRKNTFIDVELWNEDAPDQGLLPGFPEI